MPRPRALPRNFLLLLAGSLAALGLAEIAVRLAGAAPEVALVQSGRFRLSDDPEIGYEPLPNLAYSGEDLGAYDYRERSNSLGFRDVEHPLARPPSTYRVLVLGDSIAAGLKIDRREQAFPALLEGRLRAAGVPAEVLNFGVSGYDTRQEVAMLRARGLAFHPDLVVVAFCLNDLLSDNPILDGLRAQARRRTRVGVTHLNPWLVKSALYRFLRYRALPAAAGLVHPGAGRGPRPGEDEEPRPEESLRRLQEMGRRTGFGVLVAIFPRFDDIRHYAQEALHAEIRRAAEGAGLRALDLLPAFQACAAASAEPVSVDVLHPSIRGHACAADALAAAIVPLAETGRR